MSSQSARSARRSSRDITRMPPSPWIGSIRTAAVSGRDRVSHRREVAERQVVEARHHRPEALDHLLRPRRRDRAVAAAVERALEGDDPVPLRLAVVVEVLARHLDRALDRLGPRVGHEDRVGEGRRDQPLGQRLLVRDPVEVRGVPELRAPAPPAPPPAPGWRARAASPRSRAPRSRYRSPLSSTSHGALALDEGERRPRIGGQDGRYHDGLPCRPRESRRCAASLPPSQFPTRACNPPPPGGRMPRPSRGPPRRATPHAQRSMSEMSWTDERVETLKTMWSEGKSASQIAKELGGVTRNAVIGKVHRLGLSNRVGGEHPTTSAPPASRSSTTSPPSPRPRPPPRTAAAAATARPRPRTRSRRSAPSRPAPLPPQPSASEISAEALANLAEVAKKARRLNLMQLTERTCKWPVGDPATDDFWFCGLPTVPGKPYCETHVAVAFQPMSARRDRRAGGR